VLDSEAYRYRVYLSDIRGLDISVHGGDPITVIAKIRDFLQSFDADILPGPSQLARFYAFLREDWQELCLAAGLDPETASFRDMASLIQKWLLAASYVGRA